MVLSNKQTMSKQAETVEEVTQKLETLEITTTPDTNEINLHLAKNTQEEEQTESWPWMFNRTYDNKTQNPYNFFKSRLTDGVTHTMSFFDNNEPCPCN